MSLHLRTSAVGRACREPAKAKKRKGRQADAPNSPPGEASRLSERLLIGIAPHRAASRCVLELDRHHVGNAGCGIAPHPAHILLGIGGSRHDVACGASPQGSAYLGEATGLNPAVAVAAALLFSGTPERGRAGRGRGARGTGSRRLRRAPGAAISPTLVAPRVLPAVPEPPYCEPKSACSSPPERAKGLQTGVNWSRQKKCFRVTKGHKMGDSRLVTTAKPPSSVQLRSPPPTSLLQMSTVCAARCWRDAASAVPLPTDCPRGHHGVGASTPQDCIVRGGGLRTSATSRPAGCSRWHPLHILRRLQGPVRAPRIRCRDERWPLPEGSQRDYR